MREQPIREALDTYADQHLSPIIDPWPAIRRAAIQRPTGRTATPRQVAVRRRLAIPALIVVLAFGTAGATGVAHMRWFQQWTPPRAMLERVGQLHAIDQVQTVDGYTVTLRHAYADANVILLETIVHDPAGRTVTSVRPTWRLTDERGVALPQAFDSGATQVDPGIDGQYASFDAAAIQGTPATLKLRLALTIAVETPSTMPIVGDAGAIPGTKNVRAIPTPLAGAAPPARVTLPTTFAFTVPFVAGIESQPQQTVRAMDFPLTLRRVIATPTETRATVCYTPPADAGQSHWIVVANDHGQSVASVEEHEGTVGTDPGAVGEERCGELHLSGQGAASGTRELQINEVSWGPTGNETRLTGSWRFSYTLP